MPNLRHQTLSQFELSLETMTSAGVHCLQKYKFHFTITRWGNRVTFLNPSQFGALDFVAQFCPCSLEQLKRQQVDIRIPCPVSTLKWALRISFPWLLFCLRSYTFLGLIATQKIIFLSSFHSCRGTRHFTSWDTPSCLLYNHQEAHLSDHRCWNFSLNLTITQRFFYMLIVRFVWNDLRTLLS